LSASETSYKSTELLGAQEVIRGILNDGVVSPLCRETSRSLVNGRELLAASKNLLALLLVDAWKLSVCSLCRVHEVGHSKRASAATATSSLDMFSYYRRDFRAFNETRSSVLSTLLPTSSLSNILF